MRYASDHKRKTRETILKTAATEFRRHGLERARVVDAMSEAGLTHGGFYRHFAGKDQLVAYSVQWAARALAEQFLALAASRPRAEGLRLVIKQYLSERHLQHPEQGCVVAALGGELRYQSAQTQAAVDEVLSEYASSLQHLLPGRTRRARIAAFEVLFSSMAGCLMAARLLTNRSRRRALLTSARRLFIANYCQAEKSR